MLENCHVTSKNKRKKSKENIFIKLILFYFFFIVFVVVRVKALYFRIRDKFSSFYCNCFCYKINCLSLNPL